MNTIKNSKPKFGRGGRRNRRRRASLARRAANIAAHKEKLNVVADVYVEPLQPEQQVIALSDPWNEELAKIAFDLWTKSGKTQKEFAEENGFPVSRFRSWKSKIAA